METTDNTLLEMQQQMQLLKEKLDSQEIVNDKMLWNAALENMNSIQSSTDASIAYFVSFFQIALFIVFYCCGVSSIYFVIYNTLVWVSYFIMVFRRSKHLPDLQGDLVTAAGELVKIKKEYIKWGKIAVPSAIIWSLWFFWDYCAVRCGDVAIAVFLMISFITLGISVPLAFRKRASIISKMDELINQIKELQGQ